MAIKLHESWTKSLAQEPETGMGFQVLQLEGAYEPTGYAIVLNGSVLSESASGSRVLREASGTAAFVKLRAALQNHVGTVSFRVLSHEQAVNADLLPRARATGRGGASQAPLENSDPNERFLRFSAFADDHRILADGSVTRGTYVTTYHDGSTYVKTGKDAVRRYALPNRDPAVHRYLLQPPTVIPVRRGTVQPAFDQPGGGAEAIFEKGAPARTKQRQDQIPPG